MDTLVAMLQALSPLYPYALGVIAVLAVVIAASDGLQSPVP